MDHKFAATHCMPDSITNSDSSFSAANFTSIAYLPSHVTIEGGLTQYKSYILTLRHRIYSVLRPFALREQSHNLRTMLEFVITDKTGLTRSVYNGNLNL